MSSPNPHADPENTLPEDIENDEDFAPKYTVPQTKISDDVDSEDMETAAKVLEKLPDETNLPE